MREISAYFVVDAKIPKRILAFLESLRAQTKDSSLTIIGCVAMDEEVANTSVHSAATAELSASAFGFS